MSRSEDITRMRHMLDVVWQIVSKDLPALVTQLEAILG